MNNTRRTFLISVAATAAALTTTAHAQTKAPPMVDVKDPQAVSLGYVVDATKADAKKFPKYAAGQQCASCALFQGKATDAAAGCPIFAGKQVPGKGWCSAWVKKA